MSKIDLYNLNASTPPINNIGAAETNIDLTLTTSVLSQAGIIQGTVKTSGGDPIQDATIKVFSSTTGAPLYHGESGSNGKYVIPDVTKGTYAVTATKEGYLTPVVYSVTVLANQPTTQDITLAVDPDAVLNTIYGKILTTSSPASAIQGAIVNVYNTDTTPRTIIATTQTNVSGQYLLPYLAAGNYEIEASKAKYVTAESTVSIPGSSQKVDLNINLTALDAANLGTVSGFITNSLGSAIPNAVVGLYMVSGATETLVQQTKTNANGRYLFGRVENGDYVVKAFAQTNAS